MPTLSTTEGPQRVSVPQWILFQLRGRAFLGYRTRERWSGDLDFWAFTCRACGQVHVDYPHGFDRELRCPRSAYRVMERDEVAPLTRSEGDGHQIEQSAMVTSPEASQSR